MPDMVNLTDFNVTDTSISIKFRTGGKYRVGSSREIS